jgi:hypothetical protein
MAGQEVLLFESGNETEFEGLNCFHGSHSITKSNTPNMFLEAFDILKYHGRGCSSHDIVQGHLDGEGESGARLSF